MSKTIFVTFIFGLLTLFGFYDFLQALAVAFSSGILKCIFKNEINFKSKIPNKYSQSDYTFD